MTESVLITGGTGRLGVLMIGKLLSVGYKVIFTSRSEDNIKQLYSGFPEESKQKLLIGIELDQEKEDFLQVLEDELVRNNLQIHYLINNARSKDYINIKSGKHPSRKQWLGEFLLDVVSAYELSVFCVENVTGFKGIINISSIYGVVGVNRSLYKKGEMMSSVNYSVSKAALVHLTKELAIIYSKKGIKINCISYGGLEGNASEDFRKRYGSLCPSGDMLSVNEISGSIIFLLSQGSNGVTGHNLIVDGGWTAW